MSDEGHDLWEALAVGHAMRALEPEDEALLRTHLATCDRCALVLAESRELVGALASAAEPAEPPAALRDRIVAISRDTGARVAPVVSDELGRRPSDELGRRRAARGATAGATARWAAVAAVVAAVASSGVTYSLIHKDHVDTASPAYACLLDSSCQHLPLVNGGQTIGAVMLDRGQAYIMSSDLPNSGQSEQYVVWVGDSAGKMTALAAFRVNGDGLFHALDKVPDLTGVAVMAISREVRGPLPTTPSAPLGIATVPQPV